MLMVALPFKKLSFYCIISVSFLNFRSRIEYLRTIKLYFYDLLSKFCIFKGCKRMKNNRLEINLNNIYIYI